MRLCYRCNTTLCEGEESSERLVEFSPSFELNAEPKLNLFSVSEPHERREPKSSDMRSVLGLPELTNDISQSGRSPYDLFEMFPLVKGDLQQENPQVGTCTAL